MRLTEFVEVGKKNLCVNACLYRKYAVKVKENAKLELDLLEVESVPYRNHTKITI